MLLVFMINGVGIKFTEQDKKIHLSYKINQKFKGPEYPVSEYGLSQ